MTSATDYDRVATVARILGWTPEGAERDRQKQWNPLIDALAVRDWNLAIEIVEALYELDGNHGGIE